MGKASIREIGATATEYALLISLGIGGIMGTVNVLRGKVGNSLTNSGNSLLLFGPACATDGGVCTMTGTHTIRYGIPGSYAYTQATGTFTCWPTGYAANSLPNMSDPAVGSTKSCFIGND